MLSGLSTLTFSDKNFAVLIQSGFFSLETSFPNSNRDSNEAYNYVEYQK